MKSSHSFGTRGEWYVVCQFVIFAIILFGPRETPLFPRWPAELASPARIIGGFFAALGGVTALMALRNLGPNLTPLPYPKDDATLVQTGIYGFVRHPIYSGLIFLALGWAIYNRSTLVVMYALALLLFFDIKSRQEERWLGAKFAGYAAYRTRVRKLIPFVY